MSKNVSAELVFETSELAFKFVQHAKAAARDLRTEVYAITVGHGGFGVFGGENVVKFIFPSHAYKDIEELIDYLFVCWPRPTTEGDPQ